LAVDSLCLAYQAVTFFDQADRSRALVIDRDPCAGAGVIALIQTEPGGGELLVELGRVWSGR
jgi:hypothetical protein